jgi:hypothetical protein
MWKNDMPSVGFNGQPILILSLEEAKQVDTIIDKFLREVENGS